MAIGSEVFGSCVGEANVLIEMSGFAAGGNIRDYFGEGKAAQDWRRRVVVVPGIG